MLVTHQENPWPYSFMAALSKALDDAGIPNFQWGDHLNWGHYCENAPVLCGLVVSAGQLATAASILSRAGLRSCNCAHGKPCNLPNAHPPFDTAVAPRMHFTVPSLLPSNVVFLCANEDMLNLFPLTPSHLNPASLEWEEHHVQLYPNCIAADSLGAERHAIRLITAKSLAKVLMLCFLLLPPAHQHLCRHTSWTLRELAIADGENSNVGDIDCPTLDQFWRGFWQQFGVPLETAEWLQSEARRKWQSILITRCDAI